MLPGTTWTVLHGHLSFHSTVEVVVVRGYGTWGRLGEITGTGFEITTGAKIGAGEDIGGGESWGWGVFVVLWRCFVVGGVGG